MQTPGGLTSVIAVAVMTLGYLTVRGLISVRRFADAAGGLGIIAALIQIRSILTETGHG